MSTRRMSRLLLWGLLPLGVFAAGSRWWHGPAVRSTMAKQAVAADEMRQEPPAGEPGSRLIIDYVDDFTDAELAATPEIEQPVSRWSSRDRLYRVAFPSAEAAAQAAVRLRANPRVESVDWDAEASIPADERAEELQASDDRSMQAECGAAAGADQPGFPSDPCYRYQWHLRQVGLPDAWKLGQGDGVIVAVIDTGVSRVPDLADTKFVPGYNFVDDNDNAADDHGHGTHVAGTIAQSTNNKLGVGGVAFKASIMPLKVLSARGSGSMAAIAQAIRFAADNGAKVINMSLGGPFPVSAIGSAVKYARGKGVTVVAAAGNESRGRVSYPARYPGVIAVAATQYDETPTFYSNWGAEVDIAAPGGNVRVDQNGDGKPDGVLQNTIVPGQTSRTDYLWFMGTSMASPHVAGVAALIVGAGVTKPDAVEEILLGSARKPKQRTSAVATDGRIDDHLGAGIADAQAALRRIKGRRGVGELGSAVALALAGLSFLSRRGRRFDRPGVGFAAALVMGSSGLFVLPLLSGWFSSDSHVAGLVLPFLQSGVLDAADSVIAPAWRGSPIVWSALLPVAAAALGLGGSSRVRKLIAGAAFGIAGGLLFAAIAGAFDVRVIPDALDRVWLLANAGLSAALAVLVLKR